MERLRRKSWGDKKAKARESEEEEEKIAVVHKADRRAEFAERGSASSSSGFHGASQMRYDRWKMSANEGLTRRDRAFSVDIHDDSGEDDSHVGRFRKRHFSTGDIHQSTFSDTSIDRKWQFNAVVKTRWRVRFEGDDPRTNLDDLLQDMDSEDSWSFGKQPNKQLSRQSSIEDAWSPASHGSDTSPRHVNHLDDTVTADIWMQSWMLEGAGDNGVKDAGDTQSIFTISTDTCSSCGKHESDKMLEHNSNMSIDITSKYEDGASGHSYLPHNSGSGGQRAKLWKSDEFCSSSLVTDKPAESSVRSTGSIAYNMCHHRSVPENIHQAFADQEIHYTLPTTNNYEDEGITSWHYRSPFQNSSTTTLELAERVPAELNAESGRESLAEKGEHQRRLDAWVSSIHTFWDSSFDFPFSFDDNLRNFADDGHDYDFPDLQYDQSELQLLMSPAESRFGFSVIGGYDEGIPPRVEEITLGSPADRAQLEVGDEIVEVNGRSVDRWAHSEIIAHIHQCIRSKSIRLRVKRLKEGQKVPTISRVHDAYIIAVEESARRKLEDASAIHKVVPVDMTRAPPYQQEEAITAFRAETVNASPANSGTVSSKHITLQVQQPLQHQSTSPTKPPRRTSSQQPRHHTIPAEDPEPQGVEPTSVYAASMPVAEQKFGSSPSKNGGLNGSLEALEMNGMMEKERESPRKGKSGKVKNRSGKAVSNPDTPLIEDMMSHGGLAPNGKASSQNALNYCDIDQSMYDMDSDPGFQHSEQNSFSDTGPHREMAIDCPDSFIATVKTAPRYPPPLNSSTAGQTLVPRVPPTTPSKSADSVKDKARTEATLSDAALVVAVGSQPKPTADQLERLRRHQEELRKRREEESRQQQEQDFLRSSLRDSKKLQALENRRVNQLSLSTGVINTAFVDAEEEGEFGDDADGIEQSVPVERYLKKNAGVEDLLSTLHYIRSRLNSADNTSSSNGSQEVFFLKQLFHNAQFQQAVAMHQKMVDVTSRSPQPRPLGTDSQELVADVNTSSPVRGSEPAFKELVTLLNKSLLKNLLKAHDEVAERQSQPVLQVIDNELMEFPLVQYGEESVKIVHLEKTNEHLGATVKNEGDSVIIARIVQGGAAEKSGLLHEGDEILDVNGIDMRGKNVNEVSEILANMSGTITFMIIPAHTCEEDAIPKSGEIMSLRALFNYDPEDDPYIPCRELGISFLKGDVLHAMQLTDPNWWQAHREGEEEHHRLAGLIPSKSFQEQRESLRQQLSMEGKENKKRSRMCACGRKERKKKKKKALYNGGVGEDSEEILTYEQVVKYYPQPHCKRPIVLVGPGDIGRQRLRERVMESNFDRFAAAVPHTSRAPAQGEQNGKDYYFISRSVFEADMLNGKFIEYGEYQNNLYGTSVEAVRQVIQQGRTCILNLQPESLKILRDTELKPYIIFVSPPNMEKLRQLQIALGKPRPTDEQLREIIEKGREMEELYGHLFDYILVNMDLERSYNELMQEISRIEMEPQWVPITWMNYM